MKRIYNGLARRFLTTVRPAMVNRYEGEIVDGDEWERIGGWDGALVDGWYAECPAWGATIGAYGLTREEARTRLTEVLRQ